MRRCAMASAPKRVYWDACSWIAAIQNEQIRDPKTNALIEHRGRLCREVIEAAKKGVIEIATSSFSLVEVCKAPAIKTGGDEDRIRDFFDNPWVLGVPLDQAVGGRARQLMMGGHAGLKPPDASHLARALLARAEEFHTFDDKLLKLDGVLQGSNGLILRVCKPEVPAPPAPLLEELKRVQTSPRLI